MGENYRTLLEKGYLDLKQSAEALGLKHPNYVRALIKNGRLGPAEKVQHNGRPKWMVSPEAIEAYKNRPRTGRRKYTLYLNTDNNDNAIEEVRQFLTSIFRDNEFTLERAHKPAKLSKVENIVDPSEPAVNF